MLMQLGDTVLHCAVQGGSIELASLVLRSSVHANSKDSNASLLNRLNRNSVSCICIAAARLDCPMISFLLKNGADPSVGKWQGASALAAAAQQVCSPVHRTLILLLTGCRAELPASPLCCRLVQHHLTL
jgi:ankyrin repeat protein